MYDDFVYEDTSINICNPEIFNAAQMFVTIDEEEQQEDMNIEDDDDGYIRLGLTPEYASDNEVYFFEEQWPIDPHNELGFHNSQLEDETFLSEISEDSVEGVIENTNEIYEFNNNSQESEVNHEEPVVRDIEINADEILNIMASMNDLQLRMNQNQELTNESHDRSLP